MSKNILAIETATNVCSVSLFKKGEFVHEYSSNETRSHAKKLPVFVDDILKNNEMVAKELHGIAVSLGPGSYTGLRIGTSLAKGIALSLSLPLIPINTLDALCVGLTEYSEFWICLYSHRDYVFAQKFNGNAPVNNAVCLPISELDHAPKFGVDLQKIDKTVDFTALTPTSKNVGILALNEFHNLAEYNLEKVSPFYLTEFNVNK